DLERCSHRDESEGIAGAVPHLAIQGGKMRRRCRQINGSNEFAWLKIGVHLWSVGRKAVELREGDRPFSGWPADVDGGVEGSKSHAHVGWMGRDAVRRRAENRMDTMEPLNGIATAAADALVTTRGGVVEVVAAGALHQVAAGRGDVAKLGRCAHQDALRKKRVRLTYERLGSDVTAAHPVPDSQDA